MQYHSDTCQWARVFFLSLCAHVWLSVPATAQLLDQRLLQQGYRELARAAMQEGDARRGAILFYQSYLLCTQCHPTRGASAAGGTGLGPDLSDLNRQPDTEPRSRELLIESILEPSKTIHRDYQALTVVTAAGKTVTGLQVEQSERSVVLRTLEDGGRRIEFKRADLEAVRPSGLSIMPPGLVNQLASRQQFLDLARYVIEIVEQGRSRALELEPAPSLYAARALPEYEKHIDHAGMIRAFDAEGFERGREIYQRICLNCHGSPEKPGSLPTSTRFADGKFKNGSDPYTMYQTLTRGFGMMVPQVWMVPQQKYDVIHYIREAYLAKQNREQYTRVTDAYLNSLPRGSSFGPEPSQIVPWRQMNYGPNQIASYEIGEDGSNFAYKGNAIRLDPGPGGVAYGGAWLIVDYDTLRVAAAWTGSEFIDWQCIHFDGQHQVHPRIVGDVQLENLTGPGWARPGTDDFRDPRMLGRDGRPYGPLPRDWAHYKGMVYHGNQVIVSYTVGDTAVLESPSAKLLGGEWIFRRTFHIGPRSQSMLLQVGQMVDSPAPHDDAKVEVGPSVRRFVIQQPGKSAGGESTQRPLIAGVDGTLPGANWESAARGRLCLRIPAGESALRFAVWFCRTSGDRAADEVAALVAPGEMTNDLMKKMAGGPPRWPDLLSADVELGVETSALAADTIQVPLENPWFCRMRLTGIDFYPDGDRAVVTSWDGSVWLVRGLSQLPKNRSEDTGNAQVTWQRIASGLFQPLGVKIVNGEVYVTCRDQLCILHDLNGDAEIDYFESFNNDHQVTDHFHEFAMGLQADSEGNFYYAKSARHALTAVVPHHGTLLRVPKDGSRTDILATGFRAANGVCLNKDGTFIVTDQEGHWNPKNRINWVEEGKFYGNMYGYHEITNPSDSMMEQPVCWITNVFDRSPSELIWVDSDAWGPLQGALLNFSYGYGKVYIVPHERVAGRVQGGMSPLPVEQFPTGVMRGRFHPHDKQLYVCGMYAWAGTQQRPGGLYRIRYTGQPLHIPLELHARSDGMELVFSTPIDRDSGSQIDNYSVKTWRLLRSAEYGSDHYDERSLAIERAVVSPGGDRVQLRIRNMRPTWCMEIKYSLVSEEGQPFDGVIHNTVHALSEYGCPPE